MLTPHTIALFQALFVTFIWSMSWILIKIGLQDIPALVFAGLRYSIASICLIGLVFSRPTARQHIRHLNRRQWLYLMVLGVVYYAVTQGAHFLALGYLPAVTLSLMLNFTVVLVALSGIVIGESPNRVQWMGISLFIVGTVIYFEPAALPPVVGLVIGGVGVAANAAASVLGRAVNRDRQLPPLVITAVSMTIGSLLLLTVGGVTQGFPALGLSSWLIILWLAVVHTAFAFTLWNHTLRRLQAFESSLINNTMLIQIAVLAWLFLGEAISPVGGVGLACAAAGVLVVQLGKRGLGNARA